MAYLSSPVTIDSNDVFLPILVPRAAPVAISGWSSVWIIGGFVALAWLFCRRSDHEVIRLKGNWPPQDLPHPLVTSRYPLLLMN